MNHAVVPEDPIRFISDCVAQRQVLWTYHANMRLSGRSLSRSDVYDALGSYVLVESYPEDKYLPSYLILAEGSVRFHLLVATDVVGRNVRIVTGYIPDPDEWEPDFLTRRASR